MIRGAQSTTVHPRALLGPETLAARILGHPAVLLGGTRALLMQLAHPLVAAGVVDHSSFEKDPYGRLARTFSVMHDISFASPERSAEAARGLREVHRRVRGRSPAGAPYAAGDPALGLWVHATLVDTVFAVERRYIGALDEGRREQLYTETCAMAEPLGIPAAMVPADLGAFESYVAATLADLLGASPDPMVSPWAMKVADGILHPVAPSSLGPLAPAVGSASGALARAITVDLGPPELCRAYGLPGRLDPAAGAMVALAALCSRLVTPLLPASARQPSNLVALTSRLASS